MSDIESQLRACLADLCGVIKDLRAEMPKEARESIREITRARLDLALAHAQKWIQAEGTAKMKKKVKDALIVIFEETGAAVIEIHSGDREPGACIKREDIIPVARIAQGERKS